MANGQAEKLDEAAKRADIRSGGAMESTIPAPDMLKRKSRMGRLIYGLASNGEVSSKQVSQGSLEAGKMFVWKQSVYRLNWCSDQAELNDKDDSMTDGQEVERDRPPRPIARYEMTPQAEGSQSLNSGEGNETSEEFDMRVDGADIVMFETGMENPGWYDNRRS